MNALLPSQISHAVIYTSALWNSYIRGQVERVWEKGPVLDTAKDIVSGKGSEDSLRQQFKVSQKKQFEQFEF